MCMKLWRVCSECVQLNIATLKNYVGPMIQKKFQLWFHRFNSCSNPERNNSAKDLQLLKESGKQRKQFCKIHRTPCFVLHHKGKISLKAFSFSFSVDLCLQNIIDMRYCKCREAIISLVCSICLQCRSAYTLPPISVIKLELQIWGASVSAQKSCALPKKIDLYLSKVLMKKENRNISL